MKRFIAAVLSLILIFSLSVCSYASYLDLSAWNEMRDDPDNCDPGKGAAVLTDMKLRIAPNNKTVTDLEGNNVPNKVREAVIQKFYAVMMGVPVNWDKFDYAEFDVSLDVDEKITFGKQIMFDKDGFAVGSENSEIAVFDTPTKCHGVSSGNTKFIIYDKNGNELGTSDVKVRMISTGEYIVTSYCSNCGAEQEKADFHLLPSGQYSCEVGSAEN